MEKVEIPITEKEKGESVFLSVSGFTEIKEAEKENAEVGCFASSEVEIQRWQRTTVDFNLTIRTLAYYTLTHVPCHIMKVFVFLCS